MVGSRSICILDDLVPAALSKAIANESKLSDEIRSIEGMSGQKYRSFINNLISSLSDARYLEVGSWAGSTATAALYQNSVKCTCIDNWSEFGGPKEKFFSNIEKVKSPKIDFQFIEKDFRAVDYSAAGSFNVYMFDGPHEEKDQYDGLMLAQPALDSSYVFIVDDWNWERVRVGTLKAIASSNSRVSFCTEIRTTRDGSHPLIAHTQSDWHNGYFIAVLHKQRANR